MNDFFGYNQIEIIPQDQHKTAFIFPWGTFAYKKLPFGLKNVSTTFQWAMSYASHDIKHIVQPYLDDLPAKSRIREDHPKHLRKIFLHCKYYNIQLNPHKCTFSIEVGRLLRFIVSKHGICVDPLKVEAIMQFPPPRTLAQVQSLQGKVNFLRPFIANYARIMKGFMRLLKKDIPSVWDEQAQNSFDELKKALTNTSLLSPPNYNKDFLLYLAASDTTISMVLVQTNYQLNEHVI